MSKNRDYTRYSKEIDKPTERKEVIEPKEVIEQSETVEVVAEDVCTTVVEIEQEPKVEAPKYVTGVVTNCNRLNVREDPDSLARILGVITADTELIVHEADSTEDFYKIYTASGLEGYCMKNFITILP